MLTSHELDSCHVSVWVCKKWAEPGGLLPGEPNGQRWTAIKLQRCNDASSEWKLLRWVPTCWTWVTVTTLWLLCVWHCTTVLGEDNRCGRPSTGPADRSSDRHASRSLRSIPRTCYWEQMPFTCKTRISPPLRLGTRSQGKYLRACQSPWSSIMRPGWSEVKGEGATVDSPIRGQLWCFTPLGRVTVLVKLLSSKLKQWNVTTNRVQERPPLYLFLIGFMLGVK